MKQLKVALFGGILVLVTLFFTGCKTDRSGSVELAEKNWILTDSLVVRDIGFHLIRDYRRRDSLFLLYDFAEDEIVIQQKDKGIKRKLSLAGEGPAHYGRINNLCFGLRHDLWVLSRKGLFHYDFDGNLLNKLGFPFTPVFNNVSFSKHQMEVFQTAEGSYLLMYLAGRYQEIRHTRPAYYDRTRILELVNLKTGEFSPVISFDPNSRFRKNVHFLEETIPSFRIAGKYLYLLFPGEPKCYVYDIEDQLSLSKVIDLKPEQMSMESSRRFGAEHSPEIYTANFDLPRYEGFYVYGDTVLTYYKPGPEEAYFFEGYKAGKKIFRDLGQLGEQEYLAWAIGHDRLVFRNFRDPENQEDADYTVFHIYRLK